MFNMYSEIIISLFGFSPITSKNRSEHFSIMGTSLKIIFIRNYPINIVFFGKNSSTSLIFDVVNVGFMIVRILFQRSPPDVNRSNEGSSSDEIWGLIFDFFRVKKIQGYLYKLTLKIIFNNFSWWKICELFDENLLNNFQITRDKNGQMTLVDPFDTIYILTLINCAHSCGKIKI